MIVRSMRFGARRWFSKPAGSVAAGIRYAFIEGMAPQAKESVRLNMPTWLAGVTYHTGLFAAMAYLASIVLNLGLPPKLVDLMAVFSCLGALCGLALLIKRIAYSLLRRLSCPDDYASNLLATIMAAMAALYSRGLVTEGVFFGSAMALFLYMPLGKIRHCAFFFTTRIAFGTFFGRRGVLPHAPVSGENHD
jgi:hypothetical protein